MPTELFLGFSGGIVGWGTICGALVPPISLISAVVADKKIRDDMINDLMAWYTQFPFPEYQPTMKLQRVAVGSTLCHVSVTTWCNAEGVGLHAGTKERRERCAGLTVDVVKRTIEMMNGFADSGKFALAHKPHADVATCMACHKDATAPFTHGKESCMSCHGSKLIDIEKCETHKVML
jgi:hypothetical protein